MELKNIVLENIKEEIPHKLYLKLMRYGVSNLEALIQLEPEEFRKQNGVGAKALHMLDQFKRYALKNLERLQNIHDEKTQIKTLPFALEFIDESLELNIIREAVIDYTGMQELSIYNDILYDLYGFNGEGYVSKEAIAKKNKYTSERVRQLKNEFAKGIDSFLNGYPDMEVRVVANDIAIRAYTNLRMRLEQRKIISYDHIMELTYDQFSGKAFDREALVELLLDAYGFKRSAKTYTYFTKSDFVVSKEINLNKFIEVAHRVSKMLKHNGMAFKEEEVFEAYRTKYKKENPLLINKALNEIAEIESITIDGVKYYQARFEALSKVNDMACRVLEEHGKPLHLEALVDIIRNKLKKAGATRQIDRYSLIMTQHPRLSPIGRSGKWALSEWDCNKDSVKKLIIQALQSLDKPSTSKEIIKLVQQKRSDIKRETISSIVGMFCIRVLSNKWILPEWREKYADLPIAKRRVNKSRQGEGPVKKKMRQAIINYLKKQPHQQEYAAVLVNKFVPKDQKIKRPTFYRHLNNEEYFIKTRQKGKLLVKLKNTE